MVEKKKTTKKKAVKKSPSKKSFDLKAFIEESKATLLDPKKYFKAMPKEKTYLDAIIKVLIYGVVATLISIGLNALNITPAYMTQVPTAGALLISSIITSIIGLFIGALILLIISAICGGDKKYLNNIQATAALSVISPVQALAGIFFFNMYLGTLASLVVFVYSMWMLYWALVNGLKSKEMSAKIIVGIFVTLIALGNISTLVSLNKTEKQIKKYTKEMTKVTNKMTAEQKKAMAEAQKALKNFGL